MNTRVMRTRFFASLFLLTSVLHAFCQDASQLPVEGHNYDRCEDHDFGGRKTISVKFLDQGDVSVEMDDYVIKSQFANDQAYDAEVDRVLSSTTSIMERLAATAEMYHNTVILTSGSYVEEGGYLKISLEDDNILGTDFLNCEIGGRYLQCSDHNFVLTQDEVLMDGDVINISNVVHRELTFQDMPIDRWIIHIVSGNRTLENGENFQLESLYNRGKYLGHGKDGLLGLHFPDGQGISYEFRFYDEYGQGTLDALDDLKLKPAFFFGDYNYIIGVDQEKDNARISKQFDPDENLWYIEGAMCDIVDYLAASK